MRAGIDIGVAVFEITRDASYVNTANDFVSDGTYRHRGVELNGIGTIAERLTVTADLAYLATELQDVADSTTLGKRSEGVPKWKGTVGARYAIATLPGLSFKGESSSSVPRLASAAWSGSL